jgi:hypothetical protein
MRRLHILCLALCLGALPAWGQRRGGQADTGQGMGGKLAPQPELHEGRPALRFAGREGWELFVDEVQYEGEPALRFPAAERPACPGELLISESHVAVRLSVAVTTGQPSAACRSFDLPRSAVQVDRQGGKVTLSSGATSYSYLPLYENGQQHHAGMGFGGAEYLVRAVQNFPAVLQQFRKATAGLAPAAATGTSSAAATSGKGKKGKAQQSEVDITTQPGGAQVYVNDEPRGVSSEQEGRLVLKMQPGSHTLRVSLPNYQDFTQTITVVAGQPLAVTAKLEPLGPPPFTADDIVKMLQGKVSNKRITALVDERGVDFAMTADLEKRLKALGADDALLLAIATKKR